MFWSASSLCFCINLQSQNLTMKTFNLSLLSTLLCATTAVAAPALSDSSQVARRANQQQQRPQKSTPSSAASTPTPNPKQQPQSNKFCDVVDEVIVYLKNYQPAATSWCSSYLHYTNPATATVTATTKPQVVVTVPDATVTVTAAVTTQVTNQNVMTVYASNPTVTSTVIVTAPQSTQYIKRGLGKRDLGKRDLGQWLPSRVSSACSCIVTKNTATPTSTVTVTQQQTTTIGPLHTVTVPQTVFVTVTNQVTIQVRLSSTNLRDC